MFCNLMLEGHVQGLFDIKDFHRHLGGLKTLEMFAWYVLLPLFLNIRCFSFVKQMYLHIF
jgi:hypothetical protein